MNRDDLDFLVKWFNEYVKSFNTKDRFLQDNFDLKKDHTYRVIQNSNQIASCLSFNEDDMYLARAIALFHDIGRFKQFKEYRTFNDRLSVNHAAIGIEVLAESNVLSNLNIEDQHIILRAIELHNVASLPSDEPSRSLRHTRLIRDADKVDILKLITNYYETRESCKNDALDFGLLDEPGLSPIVVNDVFEGRIVKKSDLITINDMKVLYLSWIFDINYKPALKMVIESKVIPRIIDTLPKTDDVIEVCDHLSAIIINSSEYS